MSVWGKTKKVWNLTQIAATIAGSGHAPPPAGMPAYLQRQYGQYGKLQREKLGRDVKRLTTKTRQPETDLSPRDARNVRGTK